MTRSDRWPRRLFIALQVIQGIALGLLLLVAVVLFLSASADLSLFRYQQF